MSDDGDPRPAAEDVSGPADFESFKARFEAANLLSETGRAAQAEPIYQTLLQEDPRSAPLHCKLAAATAELGRLDEAMAIYERAAVIDPIFPWPHVGRAEVLEAQGRIEDAIQALERAATLDPTLEVAPRRIQGLRQKALWQAEARDGPTIRRWPANTPKSGPSEGVRTRVISWDLAHNPVGRAWVLAGLAARQGPCEVVGPIFPSYGEDLWAPLRDSDRPIDMRGYRAANFAAFVEGAVRLVAEDPCDIAWVAKPRLPGLFIGLLYKLLHGARLIVDIDDDELAFVKADAPIELDDFIETAQPGDWNDAFSTRWTQAAQGMIGWADAVTVCNPVLQARHGGHLIRHARDEQPFLDAAARRHEIRTQFGFAHEDKVVLFLGTPRRHKGVLQIAQALDRIADPAAVLCIIGSFPEPRLREELEALTGTRVVFHPDQPFSRLAELNVMADVVCILQDPADRIAQSQTPAKLTDALATGAAIIATAVPPIADLVVPGHIQAVEPQDLQGVLADMLRGRYADPQPAEARRAFFRRELSLSANEAPTRRAFEAAAASIAPVPTGFFRLLRHIDEEMPGGLRPETRRRLKGALAAGARAGPLRRTDRGVNVVFFWKQNDSGLYGRRQDMLAQALARSPRVNRVLHIDAAISAGQLQVLAAAEAPENQNGRVLANTLSRFLKAQDEPPLHRRTFVYRGRETRLLGRELPSRESFPNAVEGWMRELDMLDNVLAWVCPVVPMFREVQARMGFSHVLADVIDDQRHWPMRPQRRAEVEQGYRDTFEATRIAVANCEPVANWLRSEGLDVRMIPNGMERHTGVDSWPIPAGLARLPRPIIGYCGNLNDRIDWPLIAELADRRPGWSIVLIGSAPQTEEFRQTVSRPNVSHLGVIPYAQAVKHIAAFDVAMIAHTSTSLSERMNPLKLYVYRSLGVPVVSTEVPNIGDLAHDIRIAPTPDAFLSGVEAALAERSRRGRICPGSAVMDALSWESRLAAIWSHVDACFGEAASGGDIVANQEQAA